ncbi:MAG: stress response translation initiation inhibitor YciH [Spirochaetes bacterium]|nr:stress response translation initiation inhibitor YciH [Spirochaetota bacterium]
MKDKTVYSTERGDLRQSGTRTVPGQLPSGIKKDGIVRVRRETKGRSGKPVTVIFGLPLFEPALSSLASTLKRALGAGGTAKDGTIVIQCEDTERVIAALAREGYEAKRAGG